MNLVLQISLLLLFYNRHPFRSQCWSSLIVASLLIEPLVQGLEMHGPQHSAWNKARFRRPTRKMMFHDVSREHLSCVQMCSKPSVVALHCLVNRDFYGLRSSPILYIHIYVCVLGSVPSKIYQNISKYNHQPTGVLNAADFCLHKFRRIWLCIIQDIFKFKTMHRKHHGHGRNL